MKFTKSKAFTSRLLVALTLAVVSVTGLSGLAEAATCLTCHAPVGSTNDIRPVESAWRNITTGSIKGSHAKHIPAATLAQNTCVQCHTGAGGYTTNHANAQIDVAGGYSKPTPFAQSGNPVLGTCASASCHVSSYSTVNVTSPTWGVTTGCIGCHTGVGAFTGTGLSPATGSHTKHMAALAVCASCHVGAVAGSSGGTAHIDTNIDVQGTAISGYTANVTKHTQGSGYSTCLAAGTACHASPYGTSAVISTAWGTPGCAACHSTVGAFSASNGPSTGKHTKHMAIANTTCASCHAGAVAGNSGGAAHRDTNVDVQGTAISGYTANVTKHAAGSTYTGTCSTTCHATPYITTAGTSPSWGAASTGCALCHYAVGAFSASGGPSTGKHTKHMAITNTTCASCHAGAVAGASGGTAHSDTNIDVTGTAISGYTANVTKHAAGSTYTGTCLTSCHATPYITTAGTSPSWGAASTGCALCHYAVGAFTASSGPSTGAHTKHMAIINTTCASCHAGAVAGTSGGTAHGDTNVDVQGTAISNYTANVTKHAAGSAYVGACSTTCHTSPYATAAGSSPTWGVVNPGCGLCHNAVGAFTASGGPSTGSHTRHMTAAVGANCGSCHAGAVAGSSGGPAHGNYLIDVTGNGYPSSIAKHTAGSGYARCSASTCHADPYSTSGYTTSPTWGSPASCGECHIGIGAFSASSGPSTGKHTKHMAIANTTCASCHAGAVAGSSGGTAHIDTNIDVTGTAISGYTANVTKHAAGSTYTGTCLTSCHTTPYITTAGTSPSWGAAGGCALCHNAVGAFSASGGPSTGKHTSHMAVTNTTCASCHAGAVAGSSGGTAHSDTNVDVQGTAISGYTANVTKHAAGSTYTGTCLTSCHVTPYTTAAGTSPSWGAASAGCALCHNAVGAFTASSGPSTGKHTRHMAVTNTTCASCHAGAVAGAFGGTAHTDSNIDVQGTAISGYTANVTKHAAGSTYTGTCLTSCHVTPYTTAAGTSPSWGAASTGCALCHSGVGAFTASSGPSTGKHTKHMAVANTTCASCHAGAVAGSFGGTAHTDSNIDVTGTALSGYTANVTKHAAGSTYTGTCLTSCHVTPYTTAAGTSPSWGAASTGCALCHSGVGAFTGTGSSPVTGAHTKHMTVAGATCASCHAGAIANTSGGTAHADSNVDVTGTAISGYTANVTKHAAGSTYTGTCLTSCHTTPYSTIAATSPSWGVVNPGCVLCHSGSGAFTASNGPNTGTHSVHMSKGYVCAECHTGSVALVNGGTNHGDGNIDVIGGTLTLGYTANVTKHAVGTYSTNGTQCATTCHGTVIWGGTLSCLACHTSTAMTAPNANTLSAGAVTQRRGISTEFSQASNHTRSRGAITDADCGVCHMEGVAATGAKNAAISPTTSTGYHGNGLVELRDPDTGTTIVAQQFTGTPGAFADKAATPPAVFVRFQRNLTLRPEAETTNYVGTTNTIFEVNSAIQVKHCINCHDANGASNAAALITGGVAGKPFNATVTLNPGGSVLNVKDQFQSSNRSYHPVLAKQNNGYTGTARMVAPFNNVAKAATTAIYGALITCWDCHAANGAAGTLTATTTHGGANTGTGVVPMRGQVYTSGTTAALNLCIICHAGYTSADNHGTGSAFAALGRTAMGGINNGCYTCHGGNMTTRTARPQSAADAHGYSTRSTGAAFAQTNQGYGFIRSERFYGSTYVVNPASVGATTYSANCSGAQAGGLCSGRSSMGTFTPGGKY